MSSSVALYARVSSEEQAERGTIQNQTDFFRRYCDLHGLAVAGQYLDDGISGVVPLEERPEGARLLRDAQAKVFGQVLLYRLDRLGRDPRIILNAVHELQRTGVTIKSMTEPFETGTVYGEFMITVLGGVAGLERGVFLERSALGTARAAREGRWLGGIVPYGYRVDSEGHLQVSEAPLDGVNMTEADVVRLIYDCVANRRWSTIKVADHLNALGVPTAYAKDGRLVARGKRKVNTANVWRPSRLSRIVANPTYKGLHYYGKRTRKKKDPIERAVPATVDEVTWQRAQQVLLDNMLEATRNAKRQYLLRGLIVCDECGLRYCGTAFSRSDRPAKAWYVCNGKTAYRGPLQGKCSSKNLDAEWIENRVWNEIVQYVNSPAEAIEGLRAALAKRESKPENLEAERKQIEAVLAQHEIEKQRVMVLYRRGIARLSDVDLQVQDIEKDERQLKDRLGEIEDLLAGEEVMLGRYASAQELLESVQKSIQGDIAWEKKREIVKLLVKEVRVKTEQVNNRKQAAITITFRFDKVLARTDTGLPPSPA